MITDSQILNSSMSRVHAMDGNGDREREKKQKQRKFMDVCGNVDGILVCSHVGFHDELWVQYWLVAKAVDAHNIFGTKVILALLISTSSSSSAASTLQFTLSTIWLFRIIVCQRVMLFGFDIAIACRCTTSRGVNLVKNWMWARGDRFFK